MGSAETDNTKGRLSRARPSSEKTDLRRLEKSGITVPRAETLTPGEIRALREKYQISQAVLAQLIGASTAAVTQWEQGLRRPTGTASKVLDLVKRKGLQVLL